MKNYFNLIASGVLLGISGCSMQRASSVPAQPKADVSKTSQLSQTPDSKVPKSEANSITLDKKTSTLEHSVHAGEEIEKQLYQAIRRSDLKRIRKLLAAYPQLVHVAYENSTPLEDAISNDNSAVVNLLLDKGADVNDQSNSQGMSPLNWASGDGKVQLVRCLLARGAKVNAEASSGLTPLHNAAAGGYLDVAKILLAHGANINARTIADGETPLDMAIHDNRQSVIAYLRKQGGISQERSSVDDL